MPSCQRSHSSPTITSSYYKVLPPMLCTCSFSTGMYCKAHCCTHDATIVGGMTQFLEHICNFSFHNQLSLEGCYFRLLLALRLARHVFIVLNTLFSNRESLRIIRSLKSPQNTEFFLKPSARFEQRLYQRGMPVRGPGDRTDSVSSSLSSQLILYS